MNRANAQRSTGPRTAAGKASSSRNATKHGLLSSVALLEGEDANALAELREGLLADLGPAGMLEELFAERVVTCAWRLRRAHQVEVSVFACERDNRPRGEMATRLHKELEQPDEYPLGVAYIHAEGRAGGTFGKLARYEAGLERALYRALEELRTLQEARKSTQTHGPEGDE